MCPSWGQRFRSRSFGEGVRPLCRVKLLFGGQCCKLCPIETRLCVASMILSVRRAADLASVVVAGYFPSWLGTGARTIFVGPTKLDPPQHENSHALRFAHTVNSSPHGISAAGKLCGITGASSCNPIT